MRKNFNRLSLACVAVHQIIAMPFGCLLLLAGPVDALALESERRALEATGLVIQLDADTGLPRTIETRVGSLPKSWMAGPAQLSVRDEVTQSEAQWLKTPADAWQCQDTTLRSKTELQELPLDVFQEWSRHGDAIAWTLDFRGDSARMAHEVDIALPVLSEAAHIFTPTERGTMDISVHPNFEGIPYGSVGWETGQAWVLPLVSVMDPRTDQALTIALPADANIPHLQFAWHNGTTLRIALGHRGMGGGQSSQLRLLFFAHPADYRSALAAYVAAFPRHFRTPLPRGPHEGTFWYHHIHDHPDPAELARQNVRYIWSSFWFTHLGEYLPDLAEWEPYTYAKWWKLGETMTDAKIRTFVRAMHERGIGTYAYFNVTEYGGAGGRTGETAEAARILREQFSDALVKDAKGNDIPTWEGAMAMNPGSKYSLWPQLREQVSRHLTRLPDIDGFVIDRLDWASVVDYAHDDGLSMSGERPIENMAVPVGEAVHQVVQLAHAAGKRVFVNQFYRVEVLRDVDGVCHENDYLPALGYLTPLRPASAWHHSRPYTGDLLAFESQLKLRLQWALFPQMIAHEFPISQQAPDPRAADFLELYAPLFDTLLGKEQVLVPHCVQGTGANDVNLFINQQGQYVVPITSRGQSLSRSTAEPGPVAVTLRVPDAKRITWAHAISADGPSYQAQVAAREAETVITAERHATATMLVAGSGEEPPINDADQSGRARLRESLRSAPIPSPLRTEPPASVSTNRLRLRLTGTHVGSAGPVTVRIEDTVVGRIAENQSHLACDWIPATSVEQPPRITVCAADEGTWFVPERLEIVAAKPDGSAQRLALWQQPMSLAADSTVSQMILPSAWSVTDMPTTTAHWETRDTDSGGRWRDRLGARGVWIAGQGELAASEDGYRLELLSGTAYQWPAPIADDPRVLEHPQGIAASPTCWFANDKLCLRVTAPDAEPYRLRLYVLDFDRNGRATKATLNDEFVPLSCAEASATDTARGVYLTWTVAGNAYIELQKTAGFNVVLSGVFIDEAEDTK